MSVLPANPAKDAADLTLFAAVSCDVLRDQNATHPSTLQVGQFRKKQCSSMSENCPTFLLSLCFL